MNPEVVKTYPFIDTWRASGYQYYIIPKSMLTAGKDFGLGIDEAMLYAVLRARTSLSIKNNWIDAATGRVYIIYKRETAAEYFNWSRKKAGEVFKRLVDAGLLKEEEQPADNLAKKRMLKQPKRLFLSQWAEPSVLTSVETLKNGGFLPITRQSLDTPDGYYIIPYSFFEDEALEGLKLRSILLYAILLDKLHLSMKYGRVDDKNRVYCKVDTGELQKQLGCGHGSLSDSYKELETINLLVKVKAGYAGEYRLYLRDYMPAPACSAEIPGEQGENPYFQKGDAENGYETDAPPSYYQKSNTEMGGTVGDAPLASENDTLCFQKRNMILPEMTPECVQNRNANYLLNPSSENSFSEVSIGSPAGAPDAPVQKKTDGFHINQQDPLAAYQPEDRKGPALRAYQEQVEYPSLCQDITLMIEDEDEQEARLQTLDELLDLMAEDAASRSSYIRYGTEVVPKEEAMREYAAIDRYVMYRLIEAIQSAIGSVKKRKPYLHRALYTANSYHDGAAYYTRLEIMEKRVAAGLPLPTPLGGSKTR